MTRLCLLDKIRTMKDYINFQTTFNIFGTLFILLTSTGLWSCMKEIERLKFSTNIVLDSIESPQDIGIHEQNIKVNSNYLFANKEGFKERILKKRAAYPVDLNSNLKNYDPLTADIKDTEDYCWSLIYNRCGGSVPGAPAVGPPGPPGPPGNPGLPGRVGPMGHMGPPGLNGLKGQKGDKGYLGEIGEPGADGPRGPPGIPGTPGIQGTNGRRGKRGLPGRPGKPGENGLRGLPGQKGQKGEKGDTGAVIGPGGNCTCKGIKGDKGVRGLVGFDGYKGEPGEKGEKGDGMIGFTGTKGEPGKKGEKGDPGFCTVNCGDKYVRRKVKEPQQRYYTKPEGNHYYRHTDPTSAPTEQYTAPSTPTTTTQRITTTTTTPSTPSTIPPTISPIYMACKIRQIGKPTLVRRDTSVYGTVLGDPVQPKKIWMLQGYHGQYLEEYSSMLNFKNKNVDKTYNLQYNRFYGTQHAIYNNSLYYHFVGKQFIVRYDLNILDVTSAAQIAGSNYNNSYYLYKDSKTYYDITADENGLWVVYGKVREGASMMNIMKLDLMTLTVVKVWKLPIETGVYGNGFIACGILYLVQNTHSQRAQVNYTYDMYNDIETKVNIPIVIPFKFNTMFTFFTNTSNRKHSRLFGWDNGYVLKYPLRF